MTRRCCWHRGQASFMPISDNLGLIIVDEEHENTYKQSEPSPRYQARDCVYRIGTDYRRKSIAGQCNAIRRKHAECEVRHKYGFVGLSNRFSNVTPPQFEVVDMRDEKKKREKQGHCLAVCWWMPMKSSALVHGEQVILFLNTEKATCPITECNECSWSPRCIQCDITLNLLSEKRTD